MSEVERLRFFSPSSRRGMESDPWRGRQIAHGGLRTVDTNYSQAGLQTLAEVPWSERERERERERK